MRNRNKELKQQIVDAIQSEQTDEQILQLLDKARHDFESKPKTFFALPKPFAATKSFGSFISSNDNEVLKLAIRNNRQQLALQLLDIDGVKQKIINYSESDRFSRNNFLSLAAQYNQLDLLNKLLLLPLKEGVTIKAFTLNLDPNRSEAILLRLLDEEEVKKCIISPINSISPYSPLIQAKLYNLSETTSKIVDLYRKSMSRDDFNKVRNFVNAEVISRRNRYARQALVNFGVELKPPTIPAFSEYERAYRDYCYDEIPGEILPFKLATTQLLTNMANTLDVRREDVSDNDLFERFLKQYQCPIEQEYIKEGTIVTLSFLKNENNEDGIYSFMIYENNEGNESYFATNGRDTNNLPIIALQKYDSLEKFKAFFLKLAENVDKNTTSIRLG